MSNGRFKGSSAAALQDVEQGEQSSVPSMAMLENAPINIMFTDLDLRLRYMNRASVKTLQTLQQYLPIKVEQMIGETIDILPFDHAAATAYGQLLHELEPKRRRVLDRMVAAQARALLAGVPLVIVVALFGDWWDVRLLTPLYPLLTPALLAGIFNPTPPVIWQR